MQVNTNLPDELRNLTKALDEKPMTSDWLVISQDDTDVFAKLTDDEDPMHNDPAWAATTHWGGTIVQAAHVLSLGVGQVGKLPLETLSDGKNYILNYGYDRVRVLEPLRVGHPFRYHTKIADIRKKSEDAFVLKLSISVEVKGRETPFMVFESLAYWATNQEMGKPKATS